MNTLMWFLHYRVCLLACRNNVSMQAQWAKHGTPVSSGSLREVATLTNQQSPLLIRYLVILTSIVMLFCVYCGLNIYMLFLKILCWVEGGCGI